MYVSHLLLFTVGDPIKSLSAGYFSWRTKVHPSSLTGPAFWSSQEDHVQGRHLTKGYFLCPHLCNVDIDFDYLFLLTASLVKGTLSCCLLSGQAVAFLVVKRQWPLPWTTTWGEPAVQPLPHCVCWERTGQHCLLPCSF